MSKAQFVSYSALELFWQRLLNRIDKMYGVKNDDGSIEIGSRNRVSVKLSSASGNILEVKTGNEKGLYAAFPALHKLIFGAGQTYVYDGTEDVVVPVYNGEYNE